MEEFSWLTSLPNSVPPPCSGREWGLCSVHPVLSLLLLPAQGKTPHTLPLIQHGVPFMGDRPHQLFQPEPFPWAAVLGKLLEGGSLFSMGCNPSGTDCISNGSSAGSQILPANLLQPRLLSPWSHRSYQEPAPESTSHGATRATRLSHGPELRSLCSESPSSPPHPWVHALCPRWAQYNRAGLCCCWRQSQHITLVGN